MNQAPATCKRILLIAAVLCAGGAAFFLVAQPIGDISLVLGAGLAVDSLFLVWVAFYPATVLRIVRRGEQHFEKERTYNPGQFVP